MIHCWVVNGCSSTNLVLWVLTFGTSPWPSWTFFHQELEAGSTKRGPLHLGIQSEHCRLVEQLHLSAHRLMDPNDACYLGGMHLELSLGLSEIFGSYSQWMKCWWYGITSFSDTHEIIYTLDICPTDIVWNMQRNTPIFSGRCLPRFNGSFMAIIWGRVSWFSDVIRMTSTTRFWSLCLYPRCWLCGHGLCERHVKLVSWIFWLCRRNGCGGCPNMRFTQHRHDMCLICT